MPAKEHEMVFIPSLSGKRGVAVCRADYVRVKACILESLMDGADIILTELIETAKQRLGRDIVGDVGWLVLLVKADLERDGIVKQLGTVPGRRIPRVRVSSVHKAKKMYTSLFFKTTSIEKSV